MLFNIRNISYSLEGVGHF